MKRCVQCKGQTFEQTEHKLEQTVGDQTFAATIPAQRCTACGETYFSASDGIRFEQAVAAKLAQSGAATGDAFRCLRRTLRLRAIDLAPLLGVAAETISRWETGQRDVDRAAFGLLGVLVLEQLDHRHDTLDRLGALAHPKHRAKRVRLRLDEARKAS